MNLSAIKALCFGGKRATIYNQPFGGQWISNGFGAYLVEGVKLDSPEALMELWNLSDKARDKAKIDMAQVVDHRFTVDVWPGEEQLEELSGITWGDNDSYIALKSVHGLQRNAEKLRAYPYHWPDAEAEAAQAEAEAERMLNQNGEGEDETEGKTEI